MGKYASFLLLGSLIVTSGAAWATTITSATVYLNAPHTENATDGRNYSSDLPHANFVVGPLGLSFYDNDGYHAQIGSFLNNPVFTSTANGFDPTSTIGFGAAFTFAGTITLLSGDNYYSLGHDDGAVLMLDGYGPIVNEPGPSNFNPMPVDLYNSGPAAEVPFTLQYVECCGGPAELLLTVNRDTVGAETPEPSSLILLGTGMAGALGGLVRRRRKV